MTSPRFDPTINLGHLISLGGVTIVVIGSLYLTDYRLSAVEKNVEKLSTVIIETARTDERVKDYGRRLDALERR
jgi:hypothetical protein